MPKHTTTEVISKRDDAALQEALDDDDAEDAEGDHQCERRQHEALRARLRCRGAGSTSTS